VFALEPWYHVLKNALLPPAKLWFNWHVEGLELIPLDGPVLIAANHTSYLDPWSHGYFAVKAGRRPRFLGKAELWENWFTRTVLDGAGQIPVRRGTGDQTPLQDAAEALRRGECVVIYPEGTVTTNPDFSPMRGKTGIVRLAATGGVPVTPVAAWGGQHVWQKSGKGSLKFGRPVWLKAGTPIDLSAYAEQLADADALREGTQVVMDELARLVEDMRARYPKRWDG
jgi:1-acyl-sn-glycerol-3-phosphate acyltransferase